MEGGPSLTFQVSGLRSQVSNRLSEGIERHAQMWRSMAFYELRGANQHVPCVTHARASARGLEIHNMGQLFATFANFAHLFRTLAPSILSG